MFIQVPETSQLRNQLFGNILSRLTPNPSGDVEVYVHVHLLRNGNRLLGNNNINSVTTLIFRVIDFFFYTECLKAKVESGNVICKKKKTSCACSAQFLVGPQILLLPAI